jgi:hypothetical protein
MHSIKIYFFDIQEDNLNEFNMRGFELYNANVLRAATAI